LKLNGFFSNVNQSLQYCFITLLNNKGKVYKDLFTQKYTLLNNHVYYQCGGKDKKLGVEAIKW